MGARGAGGRAMQRYGSAADVPWAVTAEKIESVVRRIVEVAAPRRIVLFGSAARGETDRDSDVDLLVVVGPDVEDSRAECVRIRRALRDIHMPMDILVVREDQLAHLAADPGLIYAEALRTGAVLHDAA